MFRNRKVWATALLLAGAAAGLMVSEFRPLAPAQAQDKGKSGAGRYHVIDTEATNLIVVDHQTNTLLYYTVEKDGQPGDDLHLRGTLDLNEVGKPVLKPKKTAK